MDSRTAFITRVMELCEQENLTLYQLSRISGIPKSTLRSAMHPEQGNPGLKTITAIAAGFGLSLQEFFDSGLFRDVWDD